MIWMVHRAHLNDPTLKKFDFTNLKMPSGLDEPLISPKLAVAVASNDVIEELLLPSTNLQNPEAAVLAVSLRSNKKIRVLNIDSNTLRPHELESVCRGIAQQETPSLAEFRCNNVASGRQVFEAVAEMVKANDFVCKVDCGALEKPEELQIEYNKLYDSVRQANRRWRIWLLLLLLTDTVTNFLGAWVALERWRTQEGLIAAFDGMNVVVNASLWVGIILPWAIWNSRIAKPAKLFQSQSIHQSSMNTAFFIMTRDPCYLKIGGVWAITISKFAATVAGAFVSPTIALLVRHFYMSPMH